jgi:hypothetical protein
MKKEDKMSGPQFFQTGCGRKFFDHDLPELIKAINRLGDQTEKFNGMMNNDFKLTSISVDGEKLGDFVRGVVKEILKIDTSP